MNEREKLLNLANAIQFTNTVPDIGSNRRLLIRKS